MTLQAKAFNWSIGIHILILFGVFSVSRSMTAPVKVSFIDFSFSDGQTAGPGRGKGGPALSHSRISPKPQSQAIHKKQLATRPKPRERAPQTPEARVKPARGHAPVHKRAPRPVSKRTVEHLRAKKQSITSVPQAKPTSELATQQAQVEPMGTAVVPTTYDQSTGLNAQSESNPSNAATVRGDPSEIQSPISSDGGHDATAISTAGTGGGGSAQKAKSQYLSQHFVYIRDTIMKRLTYPMIARQKGWAGQVRVAFVVRRDGCVENAKVDLSSGFPLLDKNAIDTIKRASPFPVPPVEAEIIMPIQYKLN